MPNLRGVTAGAAILGVGYATWLLGGWGGPPVIRVLDNAGLVAFAVFACACAGLAASWTDGRERAAWLSLSVGAAGWAVGEALWSYLHLVAGQTPFPSWPDAGYAVFLVGAGLCLGLLLRAHPPRVQLRLAVDGLIAGAALFGAAWVMFLDQVYAARAASPLAMTMAMVYPMVDIALITMAALLLVRAPVATRPPLAALTGGLVLITLSDGAFAYLTAADGFPGSQVIAVGWAWGFLCLGIAALVTRSSRAATRTADRGSPRAAEQPSSRAAMWLPYVPVALSAVICTPVLIGGLGPVYIAAALTVFAVMIRQSLVIADNRRLLGTMADQAVRDPLTGLANRRLFQDRLSLAVQRHQRHTTAVAVLVMDLDQFKSVNDDFGHQAGDAILVRAAERLAGAVAGSGTVARFGGDEFAVLMEVDAATAALLARRVAQAFDRPFVIAEQELVVRPSVGLAVTPAEESDITGGELLRRADAAMNAAKGSTSHDVVVFTADVDVDEPPRAVAGPESAGLDGDGPESSLLLRELRHAIEHGGLSVVYQPKFDLRSYDIVGLEALVRWPHPRRGMLTPEQFLPLVRRHGLMRSVTAVVLELALDDAAGWYDKGVGVPVAINMFAPAISDPDLPEQITDALARRDLPPQALIVEITEDLLLDNMGKTRVVFNKLRDKGIRVAIDDFGSGYSALWYLREFPVDEVKLDREFIAPIMTNAASAAIVRSVIELAHALGVTPVAEGVENAETVTRLLEYGCEVAQGYLYSPPLAAPAIGRFLESQKGAVLRRREATARRAPVAARSS